ncbi:acetolactate synthase small subunit [Bacillus sp. 3255]|uniref:acetolactate synthase small subunit n=1 Tax=Bacillus sp. 3255 TaxID=2817904 RepID=UPI002854C477|nr:acetolactate synthase small subunit [Bacillus sp. 3255]MDR6883993.1 acetolactate synthase-1/3 small subunit [Bacillus sp. 3255]
MADPAQSFLLSLLVHDRPGVLQRVCMLLAKRGFNIASISVGGSEQTGFSRMTIRTYGDRKVMQQMVQQFSKLIDVITVQPVEQPFERELVLLKLAAGAGPGQEGPEYSATAIAGQVSTFGGKIVQLEAGACLVEMSGGTAEVEQFIEAIGRYPIVNMVRTGVAALSLRTEGL